MTIFSWWLYHLKKKNTHFICVYVCVLCVCVSVCRACVCPQDQLELQAVVSILMGVWGELNSAALDEQRVPLATELFLQAQCYPF